MKKFGKGKLAGKLSQATGRSGRDSQNPDGGALFVAEAHTRLRTYEEVTASLAKNGSKYAKNLGKCKEFAASIAKFSSSEARREVGLEVRDEGSSAESASDGVDPVLQSALDCAARHQYALEQLMDTLQKAVEGRFAEPLRQVMKDELEDGRQAKKKLDAARGLFDKSEKGPADKVKFEDAEVEAAAAFADAGWRTEVVTMSRLGMMWKAQAQFFKDGLAVAEAAQAEIARLSATLAENERSSEVKQQFGVHLDQLMTKNDALPSWLASAFDELDSRGTKTEGIFRINASLTFVNQLKQQVNAGLPLNLAKVDPHTIAQLVKVFLREMPDPLLTLALYDDWIGLSKKGDSVPDTIARLKELVEQLPSSNRTLLYRVAKFCSTVATNVNDTKMTASNIAIAFGPNVLRASSGGDLTYKDGNRVMELLTEHFLEVFGDAPPELPADEIPTNKAIKNLEASDSSSKRKSASHKRSGSTSSGHKRSDSSSSRGSPRSDRKERRANRKSVEPGSLDVATMTRASRSKEPTPANSDPENDSGNEKETEPEPLEVPAIVMKLTATIASVRSDLQSLPDAGSGVPMILALKEAKPQIDELRGTCPVREPLEFDRAKVLSLTNPLDKLRHTVSFALDELESFMDSLRAHGHTLPEDVFARVLTICEVVDGHLVTWDDHY